MSKLNRFLVRYFPPGILREFTRADRSRGTKIIDILTLSPDTNLDALADQIVAEEPLLTPQRRPQLRRLLARLLAKQADGDAAAATVATTYVEEAAAAGTCMT